LRITKNRIALYATLLVLLSAIPALAADVTGTWTTDDKDPNGNAFTATYVFKQDGTKLTGTVTAKLSDGDQTGNINGKVDGNKISFAVPMSDANYTLDGTIDGDEMKLTLKSDDPNFPAHEVTLKRSK